MEFSRQEYWSGLPFPYLKDLPNPRGRTRVSCIAGWCLGKPSVVWKCSISRSNYITAKPSEYWRLHTHTCIVRRRCWSQLWRHCIRINLLQLLASRYAMLPRPAVWHVERLRPRHYYTESSGWTGTRVLWLPGARARCPRAVAVTSITKHFHVPAIRPGGAHFFLI